jgi:GT2 family glycosyltransferase
VLMVKEQSSNAGNVAIIIPTYNRKERLLQCLTKLHSMTVTNFQVFVVFDGCTDGSQDEVSEKFPYTVLLEGNGQLFWAASINLGLSEAKKLGFGYYLVMNDDVFVEREMLAELQAGAKLFPRALIGPQILLHEDPTRIWASGGAFNWLTRGPFMRGNGCRIDGSFSQPAAVQWLPGMGTLVSSELLDEIGHYDAANFPQYFADTDFSHRAYRMGIQVICWPKAILYNDAASTGALLPRGGIDLKMAATILFSIRSHSAIRARWRFWNRHCPRYLVPFGLARYYLPLLVVLAKKVILDRWILKR